MKNFCAVVWGDKTHTIVPSIWIEVIGSKKYCFYPFKNVSRKARNSEPPKENWNKYLITAVLAESRKCHQ